MASSHRFSALTLFLSFSFSLIISPSRSLTCSSQTFPNNKRYERCTDLSQLSSYLHWTYDASKSTLSIAFIAPSAKPNGWISWALNPTGTGMAGAQALVAFRQTNGGMTVRTYNISSYTSIVPSKLSYDVTEMNADSSGGMMRIFATVVLPEENKATVNQVWQVGPAVVDGFPAKHDFQSPNLNSKGTFDFLSEKTNSGAGNNIIKKRNIHGILNTVSWGFLFPLGIIVARYIKTFEFANPAWFYLHVSCQCSAYVLGVAGWGTGLKLGSDSTAITYTYHRNIGIALFALATIQVFALFLRPSKEHKYRLYWNIYHHSIGYAVLILGILNVFKGLAILGPGKAWKTAYFVVIIVLGAIAVLLEAFTWIIVSKRKSNRSTKL